MLNRVDNKLESTGMIVGHGGHDKIMPFDIGAAFRTLRRHYILIGSITLGFLVAGLVYILTTPPSYTATATVLIDAQRLKLFRDDALFEGSLLNNSVVESEIQILSSRKVTEDVVRTLNLMENETFMRPPRGLLESAIAHVSGFISNLTQGKREKTGDLMDTASDRLRDNTKALRAGMSYVLQVSYTSHSPALAAEIANTIAKTYMADQIGSKVDATEKASEWLQTRVVELREKATEADRAVQTFKAENTLINAGQGELLNERQVSEINTQLLRAKDESSQAKARFDRIREINKADVPDAAVAEMLNSDLIRSLRQQYVDLSTREREASERYGAQHASTVSLRNQMLAIRRSISTELKQLEEIAKSNVEIADARVATLERTLDGLVLKSGDVLQSQVKLRELESAAQAYRTLHDSFLQRYVQAVQQQSFPISDSRLITPAVAPDQKSAPKGSLILPLSLVLGLAVGVGAALSREWLQKGVRTSRQLETVTDAPCLGILPQIQPPPQGTQRAMQRAWAERKSENGGRLIRCEDYKLSVVLDQPFSHFSETIRSIKVAADIQEAVERAQVMAVTSAVAQEGKSVASANLARLTAHAGKRTLLIDCDLRNPSLTRALAPLAKVGLSDILKKRVSLEEAVFLDPLTDLHFLPASLNANIAYSNEFIASQAMVRLIEECRSRYSRIIIDFPPVLPVVDVRAGAHLPDAFLMVVDWTTTPSEVVQSALQGTPVMHQKLVGAVLNKVDIKTLGLYEPVREVYYRGTAAA
ncbi:Wzz/FepE/Etk N-terminal domain-containing protein [Microvirga pudoricolor]|uniref:Wzz/FepE/Etk N-terminal domain-containing protein n=1 Tax=Microvirga pudoricolor TaxID=2778729 RepID=UPI00194E3760|nr:Wzz/FepE/Etk N-terminal domain-containing protein [Microvirga pudoricolor]MBM6593256.1 AAA family ATPase [Microvirga pudoricolor]